MEKFYDFSTAYAIISDNIIQAKHIKDQRAVRMMETMRRKMEEVEKKVNAK